MYIHLIHPCTGMVLKHLFSVFSCINYSKAFPSFCAILLWMKELVSHKGNSRMWTLISISKRLNCLLRCQLLSLAHCYHLNLFIIYEVMAISFFFEFSTKEEVKLIYKRLLVSGKTQWNTNKITGCYRNVDYWTLNSCLQQWPHLQLQSM